jgi:TPR repeat protein
VYADAQFNLGALYANGQGAPQNKVIAYALFNPAVARDSSGDERATQVRAWLATQMTQQEIKAGQALSQEMSRPGNLLNALDQYLVTSGTNNH